MKVKHTYREGREGHAHSSKAIKNQCDKNEYRKFWNKNIPPLSVYCTHTNISIKCSDYVEQISSNPTIGVTGSIGNKQTGQAKTGTKIGRTAVRKNIYILKCKINAY